MSSAFGFFCLRLPARKAHARAACQAHHNPRNARKDRTTYRHRALFEHGWSLIAQPAALVQVGCSRVSTKMRSSDRIRPNEKKRSDRAPGSACGCNLEELTTRKLPIGAVRGSRHRLVRPPRDDLPHAGERICSRDRRAVDGRRLELNEECIVDHTHVSHIGFAYVVRRN